MSVPKKKVCYSVLLFFSIFEDIICEGLGRGLKIQVGQLLSMSSGV